MTPPVALDVEGHAVQRFIERCFAPGAVIRFEEAERRLNVVRSRAFYVDNIDNGQQLWRGFDVLLEREVLMVVKDGVVRTVLAPGSWDFNRR